MITNPPYTEVRFTLPYSLPFEGEFDFEWRDESFSVKIENIQIYDQRSEQVTGFQVHTSGSGSVTVGGHHGLSHLSNVTVRFRILIDQDHADDAKERACLGVNRLVEVCREGTRDFRIRRVMPQHDVISFETEVFEEDGSGTVGFQLGSESKLTYPSKFRSFEDASADIDEMLKAQYRIPAWEEYRHAARRFFEEREFAPAVMLMNAALELFWAELLRAGLRERGDAEQEIERNMNKWLASKSTLHTLQREFSGVFGKSLKTANPALWADLQRARQLRKNVIHPWVKTPSAEETFQAMAAIELTMRWLVSSAEHQVSVVRRSVS